MLENNNELFVMNTESGPAALEPASGFYFLNVQSGLSVDIAPIYKLLFTETKEYKIPLTTLTVPTQKKILSGKKENILENYLLNLKKSLQGDLKQPKKLGKIKL